MNYSEENWYELLESLGFTERKNPNGVDCYDIYDDRELPIWQYETIEKKIWLFYFLSGALYGKNHFGK